MAASQHNQQGERALVAEWLATLPKSWPTKTQLKVGSDPLFYGGKRLTPGQSRALGVWSDWCDVRVVTPAEIWIVEGKLVATASAYGQVIDYLDQYATGDDVAKWPGRQVVGIVLAQATRPRLATLFARMGIRTIQFTPSWPVVESLARIFPSAQIVQSD